jgi:hypothetical protein
LRGGENRTENKQNRPENQARTQALCSGQRDPSQGGSASDAARFLLREEVYGAIESARLFLDVLMPLVAADDVPGIRYAYSKFAAFGRVVAGIELTVKDDRLIIAVGSKSDANLLGELRAHEAAVVACSREGTKPVQPAEAVCPRIKAERPFGSDDVPARFRPAWQLLLAQCPPSVTPFVWQTAIFDGATLFGDFGKLIDNRWTAGDLFDVPHDGNTGGLIWFIKGSPVVAIGRSMAQRQDGRIWRRAERMGLPPAMRE